MSELWFSMNEWRYICIYSSFDIFIITADKRRQNSPPLLLYTELPLGQRRFIWLIKVSQLRIPGPGSEGSWGIPDDRPDKFLLFQYFSASSASSSYTVRAETVWEDVNRIGAAFTLIAAPSESQSFHMFLPPILRLSAPNLHDEPIHKPALLIIWQLPTRESKDTWSQLTASLSPLMMLNGKRYPSSSTYLSTKIPPSSYYHCHYQRKENVLKTWQHGRVTDMLTNLSHLRLHML